MADFTDPPANEPKKKKKFLAFLRSTPKPAPTFDEDFDFNSDNGKKNKREDDDEDGLNMFKRSKDFFPTVVKERSNDPREATPESKPETKKHAAEDSDEEPVASSSRSSKRRKLSSPVSEPEHPWRVESYDELYGPATPPRRDAKSPTPASRKSHREISTPASAKYIESAIYPIGKSKGKGKETVNLVQSDVLPTPISRSNSHQLSADVIALADDGDVTAGAGSWRNHTPSPRKAKVETRSAEEEQSLSTAIVIDDSDDDKDLFTTASEPKDDELAHFITAARKKQEAAKAAAAALAVPDDSSDNEQDPLTNVARARAKNSVPFVPVKIFIHSRIAAYADYDMRGFGCHRKIDQELGPVRGAFVKWLRIKGVPVSDEMDQAIFLTWKGRRIYDSVSGLSLGWQPQGNNKSYASVREPGFTRDGVLLEAWTQEDFERYTADIERQRLINRGELVEDGPGVEIDDDADEIVEPEVAKVRLILKEKDTEGIKLTTYLDTQVRVLIGAYRKQKKVAEDREIKLMYEGDRLNPEMTIEQADIDDLCTVEVYLT